MFGGILSTAQKRSSGGGVVIAGVRNGLSIDDDDNIVLGGELLEDTEIDLSEFYLQLTNGAGYLKFNPLGEGAALDLLFDVENADGTPVVSIGAENGGLLSVLLFTTSADASAAAEYTAANGNGGALLGVNGLSHADAANVAYVGSSAASAFWIDVRDDVPYIVRINEFVQEIHRLGEVTALMADNVGAKLGFAMYAGQTIEPNLLRGVVTLDVNSGEFALGARGSGYFLNLYTNDTVRMRLAADDTRHISDVPFYFEPATGGSVNVGFAVADSTHARLGGFTQNVGTGNVFITSKNDGFNEITLDFATRDVAFYNNISTGDPGEGSGKWKLGKHVVDFDFPMALADNQWLEVEVDGVVYKVALVIESV